MLIATLLYSNNKTEVARWFLFCKCWGNWHCHYLQILRYLTQGWILKFQKGAPKPRHCKR